MLANFWYFFGVCTKKCHFGLMNSYRIFYAGNASEKELEAYDDGVYYGRWKECQSLTAVLDWIQQKHGSEEVQQIINDCLEGEDPREELFEKQKAQEEYFENLPA